ncbi:leucine-rich repeat-containing protein 45-like [Haliotis rufescens]|uniref:leucine-rich repeat-containing protein 45-like n=1 Tax=Haliotis rufescens TaxID=6454 RepID=UPI00201F9F41|nr:leucine-rich repeat-containing protein 45-like [Haliotis rufescens]
MDDFRQVYVRLCKDNHVEAQDCIVEKLKSLTHAGSKGRTTLDLSTNSLTPKSCAVLGKVIAPDRTFTEYKFADCMLSEDALKGLSQGFIHNSYCKKLDLKGNNIRGAGTEALGKLLRQNHSIVSLCLEWNAMGMLDMAFAVFCDGVGSSSSLQALDLRNNQINHEGASELAANLKRNTTLRALDLRWNNIGLLGGRALIEMLKSNKTLSRLELAGNNIPSDILKSIETAVDNNADRQLLTQSHRKQTHSLSKHISQLEHDKHIQIGDLMDTLDKQEDLLRKSKRTASHRVNSLQDALEDRKGAFNSLAAKLSMTESELVLAEQKVTDCNLVINRLKNDLSERAAAQVSEMRHEREDRANEEMKLLKELSESNDKNIQLQTKVDDLDRKCRNQQEQVFELKEQITHLQAELKLKGTQFDERLQQERQRQKDAVRDMEQYKQKEIMRTKQEGDDVEKALRERIQKLEEQRMGLEEEASRLKTANMADRMTAEEQLTHTKQRIKAEEEQRQKQLEEKIRVLQTSKDELKSHCNQQASLVSELQCKNSNLTLELETLKRRLEEMGQELAEKNNITFAEVSKVKMDLNSSVNKLEEERHLHNTLRDKLSQTDRQLSEQMLKNREQLEHKEREIVSLEERLRARDMDIARIKEEEVQRAHMLQSAIMNYVSKTPYSSPTK